jgi:hypothetical protein
VLPSGFEIGQVIKSIILRSKGPDTFDPGEIAITVIPVPIPVPGLNLVMRRVGSSNGILPDSFRERLFSVLLTDISRRIPDTGYRGNSIRTLQVYCLCNALPGVRAIGAPGSV